MLANLDLTRGAIVAEAAMMELAHSVCHERAHVLVTAASRRVADEGIALAAALRDDGETSAHLTPEDVERLADPTGYVGLAAAAADAVAARASVPAGVGS